MTRGRSGILGLILAAGVISHSLFRPVRLSAQRERPEVLTENEADQLRDQQDAGGRIELYLNFAQVRLDLFENFRSRAHDPKYDNGGYLDQVLVQYVAIDN